MTCIVTSFLLPRRAVDLLLRISYKMRPNWTTGKTTPHDAQPRPRRLFAKAFPAPSAPTATSISGGRFHGAIFMGAPFLQMQLHPSATTEVFHHSTCPRAKYGGVDLLAPIPFRTRPPPQDTCHCASPNDDHTTQKFPK